MNQYGLHLHARKREQVNVVFGSNPEVLRLIGQTMVRKGPYGVAELLDHNTALVARFSDGITGWSDTGRNQ